MGFFEEKILLVAKTWRKLNSKRLFDVQVSKNAK